MDLLKGQVTARAELPRQPIALRLSSDGATAAVFYGGVGWKYQSLSADEMPYSNAELQFFDAAALRPLGQLAFDGAIHAPIFSPEGDCLYLIDKGQPSNNPQKNVNGKIHAVSLQEKKEMAILDAGDDPGAVFSDAESGQLFLLSNGAPVKGEKQVDGEVRVLRGASIVSLLKVASRPQFVRVSPDRKRLYIVSPNTITVLDRSELREQGRIAMNGWASDLAFDPQGKLGFVLHPESSQMTILDLDAMRQTASVTTGRAGVKFAKALGAVALTAASATAAYGQAYNMASTNGGVGYGFYSCLHRCPGPYLHCRQARR